MEKGVTAMHKKHKRKVNVSNILLKKKFFAKQAWQDVYPDCKSSITNISASKIEKSKLRKQRKKELYLCRTTNMNNLPTN